VQRMINYYAWPLGHLLQYPCCPHCLNTEHEISAQLVSVTSSGTNVMTRLAFCFHRVGLPTSHWPLFCCGGNIGNVA